MADNGERQDRRPPFSHRRRPSNRESNQPPPEHPLADANPYTLAGSRRHSGGQYNHNQQHGYRGQRHHSFSHHNPTPASPTPNSQRRVSQNASQNSEFRSRARFKMNTWNSNGPNQESTNDLSPAALQEFLSTGIEKIQLSEDSRQAFVGHLASQNGLEKVRQLLEAEYSTNYSITRPKFGTHCVSFLRILSNSAILSSLSLEQQVRTIYNVVYGFNGERAVPFFDRVLECLVTLRPDDEPGSMEEEDWYDALEVTTSVFLNTLRMNQGAAIQEKLKYIGQRLAGIAQTDDQGGDDTLAVISQNISNITSILSAGAEVPQERTSRDIKKKPQKEEEDVIDLPGELSLLGPRHDNDHELISDISILPTVSEILSNRPEFLPTKRAYEENSHHHQEGIQRLVDIQFRLLREDTSGQVRNATRFVLKHWEQIMAPVSNSAEWQAKRKLVRDGCQTPLRLYFGVDIQKLKFEGKGGLEAVVEFEQPRALRRWTFAKRQWWWRKSMELRENKSVMALIEKTPEDTNVVFLVVAHRNVSNQEQANPEEPSEGRPINDLCSDPDRAAIGLRMIALGNEKEQARLIHLATKYSSYDKQRALLMVEFPAVLYRQFEGILRCLKIIHANPTELPFGKWLAPRLEGLEERLSDHTIQTDGSLIPPPAYFRGQFLDLSACCDPPPGSMAAAPNTFTFTLGDDQETVVKKLAQQSSLDHGQAKAMISAFRHEVALTQGPPGCGKSYIGVKMVAALLANKARLSLGPILCICYTNHALDQFLSELLKLGITNIARIGSPSPLPHIESLSFENYKKACPKIPIRGHGRSIAATGEVMTRLQDEISELCLQLEADSVTMVMRYLEKHLPQKLQDIVNGAKLYGFDPTCEDRAQAVSFWISGTAGFPEDESGKPLEELLEVPTWSLSASERYRLFAHCHQSVVDALTQRIQASLAQFATTKTTRTRLFLDSDRKYLEKVDILGITTVGLVNNSELVRTLPAKVMVCEEAGEVLESHVLTALLPSIQHVILIGDHLQLRPKISTVSLSKEYDRRDKRQYNLDESLFERLAGVKFNVRKQNEDGEGIIETVGFPIGQLDIQRRMHPDIANLVRTTLYPELHDHEGTTGYPDVAGIKRRLFWLDHRNFEDPSDPGEAMQSKTNTWEARMVASLVTYLARQGVYKTGEIAVLTPYINQMRMLMEMFEDIVDYDISERDMEELDLPEDEEESKGGKKKPQIKKSKVLDRIRIATVDNFQGEEATVIIVCLVRSNERNNCGFLKTTNRINVLLSRAKHGMYIIGDAATSAHVPMWREVITLLENSGNIGPKLQLKCPRHPAKKTFVGCPEDFEAQCPEGGCSERGAFHAGARRIWPDSLARKWCKNPCLVVVIRPSSIASEVTTQILFALRSVGIYFLVGTLANEDAASARTQGRTQNARQPAGRTTDSVGISAPKFATKELLVLPRVDLLTFEAYENIDLNEDPVIVLKCGHIYTMSSLDGFLDLEKHYQVDQDAGKRRILMSGEALKGCPDCRRPFRNIDRYNRVFKSVLLDELTRRFVARSTAEYAGLMEKLEAFENGIETARDALIEKCVDEKPDQARTSLNDYKKKGRYIQRLIREFNVSVMETEQPLTKVNDLYNAALAKRDSAEEGQSFDFDKARIQTGLTYRGKCLDAKAKFVILSDWQKISDHRMIPLSIKRSLRDSIQTEVKQAIQDTATLRKQCQEAHLPYHEVEARVYHAHFSILHILNNKARDAKIDETAEANVKKEELNSLTKCENLCKRYPGTLGRLQIIVETAKRAVNGQVFYTQVTSEEEMMVIRAMAEEFLGSGHWYYCVNGHPFTIGDCGMPMELARCPECGQQIGGQDHIAIEGVRLATDFEARNNS
ncbi:uncharacterized protein DFL_003756 [Arthrobotrys flagrans]|uniref:RZ-type domain-containing protein n=1 Tax=Arthrobotrys flagrans TaxID=97331 RepID=A0A437A2Q9_ARTFL|nr:hypothetical protein DFL_003756 [Arthrobotrys flagrans]